tara:strand:- start:360 stop:620 length:261 start_codon:yes stop_codon:yes gene_type:complete
MIKNIVKFFILTTVISFFIVVYNYYLSEKNINLVKNNRENLEIDLEKKNLDLPILENNIADAIEFNSGYNNTRKQNYKRNFWDLFK